MTGPGALVAAAPVASLATGAAGVALWQALALWQAPALWLFAGAPPRSRQGLAAHPRFDPGQRAGGRAMAALGATLATSLFVGAAPVGLWARALVPPLCALFILTRPVPRPPAQWSPQ